MSTFSAEWVMLRREIDRLRAELEAARPLIAIGDAVIDRNGRPLTPRSAREARNGYAAGWFDALDVVIADGMAATNPERSDA